MDRKSGYSFKKIEYFSPIFGDFYKKNWTCSDLKIPKNFPPQSKNKIK
jgi:hypothetical protein